jgi:hypothetical protein
MAAFHLAHGCSTDILVFESPDNIIRLAQFDAFIHHMLGCHHWHSDPSLDTNIAATLKKQSKPPDKTTSDDRQPRYK